MLAGAVICRSEPKAKQSSKYSSTADLQALSQPIVDASYYFSDDLKAEFGLLGVPFCRTLS